MKHVLLSAVLGFAAAGAAYADGHRAAPPEGARAYIISPADGATLSNPVTILFGLEGMGVAPADIEIPDTGHFHVLINTDLATLDMESGLPATDEIIHFGRGQIQTTMDLPAGTHTLQLLMGDWTHVPHNPPVASEVITVTVQ